jgi:hypothetical protein
LRMDDGIVDKNKDSVKKAWSNLSKPKVNDLFIEYEVRS